MPGSGPIVTVQARRPAEDFWMVWVDQALAGSVHSMAELEQLLDEREADLDHVRWEAGAEEDLRSSKALPPGNRSG
jgi:hypothetical protein